MSTPVPAGREPLTKRQQAALDSIVEHVKRRGYPPTRKQLAQHIGLANPSSAGFVLHGLVRKGWIRVESGSPRAIEVIPS